MSNTEILNLVKFCTLNKVEKVGINGFIQNATNYILDNEIKLTDEICDKIEIKGFKSESEYLKEILTVLHPTKN